MAPEAGLRGVVAVHRGEEAVGLEGEAAELLEVLEDDSPAQEEAPSPARFHHHPAIRIFQNINR